MSTTRQLEKEISTTSVCDCEEQYRSSCAREIIFREQEGLRYCVLHYPGKEKIEWFRLALNRKIEAGDFDFRGVWFPEEVSFAGIQFSSNAAFSGAFFSERAIFDHTSFPADAKFYQAIFNAGAEFYQAVFNARAIFFDAIFGQELNFKRARFSADADFSKASFRANVDFRFATFAGYVRFGDKTHEVFNTNTYLNLQHVRIERPERVSFHSLRLRPHWFVNVDARKFEFVNVEWSRNLKHELEGLRSYLNSSPYRLLSIAYRQLAVNAEENHRYGEAAEFRYGSMDLRRLEWSRSSKKAYDKGIRVLHWLYWIASGYGERVTRAIIVLIAFWLAFAFFYTRTGFEQRVFSNNAQIPISLPEDEIAKPLPFKRALTYSLGVLSLQKPDPKPLTNTAQTLVTLETVLGPVQAALLGLAIRRRFMR